MRHSTFTNSNACFNISLTHSLEYVGGNRKHNIKARRTLHTKKKKKKTKAK